MAQPLIRLFHVSPSGGWCPVQGIYLFIFFYDKLFCYINIGEWFFEIYVLKEKHVSCVLFYCEETAEIV